MDSPTPNNSPREFGPVVGAVIIVGLLVVGGLYFFLMQEQKLNTPPMPDATEQTNT